jgi:hypothetical protein
MRAKDASDNNTPRGFERSASATSVSVREAPEGAGPTPPATDRSSNITGPEAEVNSGQGKFAYIAVQSTPRAGSQRPKPAPTEAPRGLDRLKALSSRRCRSRQRAFLIGFQITVSLTRSAQAAGIGRRRHYHWMKQDPQYRAAFTEVKEDLFEQLHEEARRRAMEGDLVPIFYNGVQCGTVRRYSARLLMFLLQLEMPEKYGHWRRSRAKAAPGPPADLAERLREGRARVAQFRAEERAEQERKARPEGPA